MVFRSATLLVTGTAFVNHGKLCGQSEGLIALGRFDCGSVYRRAIAGDEPAFIYVNSTNVFYFSPID